MITQKKFENCMQNMTSYDTYRQPLKSHSFKSYHQKSSPQVSPTLTMKSLPLLIVMIITTPLMANGFEHEDDRYYDDVIKPVTTPYATRCQCPLSQSVSRGSLKSSKTPGIRSSRATRLVAIAVPSIT